MLAKIVTIPTAEIVDWQSFHNCSMAALGFPKFYGHNMDAWIDCMTYVDDPTSGMMAHNINAGELLVLKLQNALDFKKRCPEQYQALLEAITIVNFRRTEIGDAAVLAVIL